MLLSLAASEEYAVSNEFTHWDQGMVPLPALKPQLGYRSTVEINNIDGFGCLTVCKSPWWKDVGSL